MKILIVETGLPPSPIPSEKGYYPTMFRRLLDAQVANVHYETCSIITGDNLPNETNHDGIVILGSPHSVYEDLPWINELVGFVQNAAKQKIPQIGICFGHQLIAKAMGGYVAKAPQGWGIGRHTYQIHREQLNKFDVAICPKKDHFNLLVSHQDQVLEKPDGAKIIAHSDFTPNAILHYEQENIVTCQAHPEFTSDFAHNLIASRRGTRFPEEFADKALANIHDDTDGDLIAEIIGQHLKTNTSPKKAA